MRAGGGKAKGGAFERDVCRALSLYGSNGQREDLFWRSAMSGGRATVKERKGLLATTQAGDISAVDPLGHKLTDVFLVECKFYKDLNLLSFFGLPVSGAGPGVLSKFWEETVAKAKVNDRLPALIAKQNNRTAILVLFARDVMSEKTESALVFFGPGKSLVHVYDGGAGLAIFEFLFPPRTPGKAKPKVRTK